MTISRPSRARVALVGLLIGFVINLIGWLGNNLVLGPMWADALTDLPTTPWRDTVWRHVVSFAPDFVYGLSLAWAYVALAARYGARLATAVRASLLVLVVGAITTYVALANSGFLPWGLSGAAILLAVVSFVPASWMTHRLLQGNV